MGQWSQFKIKIDNWSYEMNLQNILLLAIMAVMYGIGFYLRARKTEKIEKSNESVQ